jgi:hypothetical protein
LGLKRFFLKKIKNSKWIKSKLEMTSLWQSITPPEPEPKPLGEPEPKEEAKEEVKEKEPGEVEAEAKEEVKEKEPGEVEAEGKEEVKESVGGEAATEPEPLGEEVKEKKKAPGELAPPLGELGKRRKTTMLAVSDAQEDEALLKQNIEDNAVFYKLPRDKRYFTAAQLEYQICNHMFPSSRSFEEDRELLRTLTPVLFASIKRECKNAIAWKIPGDYGAEWSLITNQLIKDHGRDMQKI